MTALLSITQLKKKMNHFNLGPIDLTIEPGTITAIVGNNGSGKSTLLKSIMQLVKPDRGSIKLLGNNIHEPNENWKQHIAYQPQSTVGYDTFTGNSLKQLISNWYPNWDERLFKNMIDRLEIPLNKQFGTLSQGVQQKLLLALTIPRNTKLLLLDEPTTFIDIPARKVLFDFLIDWMEADDRSLVITSHQVDDIKKLADYLFVLKDGDVLGHVEKESLIANYQRYWIKKTSHHQQIPGVIFSDAQTIISNDPTATEHFLQKHTIQWHERSTLELQEIMTLLLTNWKG